MRNKGYLLLGSLLVFVLGSLLMFSILGASQQALRTMQRKILLEDALTAAEAALYGQSNPTELTVSTQATAAAPSGPVLREIQVSNHGKVIFTLTTAE